MDRTFGVVILIVAVFLGFLLGYSIPPFIHAGVFSEREEKGVEVLVDEELKEYYEKLYQTQEEE